MNHLSPAEFADAAEGALAPARTSHLDACARCRSEAEALCASVAEARGVDAPEPSPLYWDHLAARVRERVAGETIVAAWRAEPWWAGARARLVPVASALALAAAVLATGLVVRHTPRVGRAVEAPALAGTAPSDLGVDPTESAVWELLTSAADEMPIEDAHAAGMAVPAAAIDHAVQRMSPDERAELGRLLQTELRGLGN